MKRRAVPVSEPITRVNVTPIIDVALVLVIILMVTAPMMAVSNLPVDLPQARTREAERERNLSITLGRDGQLAIDDQNVSADTLHAALARRLSQPGEEDLLVVVRADAGTSYAQVRELLDQARAAGARRLAIATRQKMEVPQ